ncbi:MAG TPA: hypothetical protein VHR45_12880 [Thermoanaerobaculia bacterium]|nr:hypothetical protein [Thermoanaerobaculia bacterium]
MRTRCSAIAVAALAALALTGVAAAQGGPFQYHALTPCRVVDSRTVNATEGTNGSPISNGYHSFRIQGQCGVPNGAAAITGNFTIVNPSASGFLVAWPANQPHPNASMCNHLANETLACGAIVPLGPVSQATDKDITIQNALFFAPAPSGSADFIIDVTGYFQ